MKPTVVKLRVVGVRELRKLLENASRRYAITVRTIEAATRRLRALTAQAATNRGDAT